MRRLVIGAGPPERRLSFAELLSGDEENEVVAEATDVSSALAAVRRARPDLLVLDAAIPPTDAATAVRRLMAEEPCPVLVVATETRHAGPTVHDQLRESGALSVVDLWAPQDTEDRSSQELVLLDAVRLLAGMAVVGRRRRFASGSPDTGRPDTGRPDSPHVVTPTSTSGVVAIAASTGGPEALARVLSGLPADFPLPLLLVQHISTGFHETLARWLDERSPLAVRVAAPGDVSRPGLALLAPSGCHLVLGRGGRIELDERTEPVAGHLPSATQLFRSVARVSGRESIGVVLSGMGVDGRQGLLELKAAGGYVIAQDEATSTIFGMAKEAIGAGAVDAVVPLGEIARALLVRTKRLSPA